MNTIVAEDEGFAKGIRLIAQCLSQGCLRLRFAGIHEAPQLEITSKTLLEEAKKSFGVSDEAFISIHHELPDMIGAVLTNTQTPYISMRTSVNIRRLTQQAGKSVTDEEAEQKTTVETLRKRLQLVREELITPRITERFVLRKTSANPLLLQCSGEVAKQVYSTVTNAGVGYYATLVVFTEGVDVAENTPVFFSSIGFPFGDRKRQDQITLACDESDLDALIDVLLNLRDRLKEQVKLETQQNDSN